MPSSVQRLHAGLPTPASQMSSLYSAEPEEVLPPAVIVASAATSIR
ncbi:MAG TPA: hypothetical protein VMU33_06005 [Burkholderiaceae bacterium]|nr:hypothetical protein [Burkholderiaceae bacterium]